VNTLLNILVCLTGFHSTVSQDLDSQEVSPWWKSFELSGDPTRRELRGDKDGFWAVRGKRDGQLTDEIGLGDEKYSPYINLIHQLIQEYSALEHIVDQMETKHHSKRFMKPNGLFNSVQKKASFSKPNGLFSPISSGKRATIVKPNGLFMAMPGKKSLKPNGLFTSMMKRPLKPNGLFNLSGKRVSSSDNQPSKRSLKPNGFFLLKRKFKPNGIFTTMKRGFEMNDSDEVDEDYLEDDEYSMESAEEDEHMSDMAKRDDNSFWAVRGKKADGDFWAVRGKRDLEEPDETADTTTKLTKNTE